MITYHAIPTLSTWVNDLTEALGARIEAPGTEQQVREDRVIPIMYNLLEQYDELRTADLERAAFRKHLIAFYLYEAADYWLTKRDRSPKLRIEGAAPGPRFTAGLSIDEGAPIKALRDVSESAVRGLYGLLDTDEREAIRSAIVNGVGLPNTQADDDETKRGDQRFVWLSTAASRLRFKLRFRNGLAYRMEHPFLAADPDISLFTTKPEESEAGDAMTHFVMDADGHIYCGYHKAKGTLFLFVHSSLVAGKPTLAAGMMRVVNGQVDMIKNASGHYKPEGRHMALLLQRLRVYGVNLANVRVQKHDAPGEVYSAEQILVWNGWPS